MKRLISTILFFSLHILSIACDCSSIENLKDFRKQAYNNADLIFTADVVSVGENFDYTYQGWFDNKIFEVRVTENFKGTQIGEILKGHALTSCSGYPDEGTWLIYANIDKNNMISFSICSLSRSFFEPNRIHYSKYVPKPPSKEDIENPKLDDTLDSAIKYAELKLLSVKDLKEEILWLRSKK